MKFGLNRTSKVKTGPTTDQFEHVGLADTLAIRRLHPRRQSRRVYDKVPISFPALPASSPTQCHVTSQT